MNVSDDVLHRAGDYPVCFKSRHCVCRIIGDARENSKGTGRHTMKIFRIAVWP